MNRVAGLNSTTRLWKNLILQNWPKSASEHLPKKNLRILIRAQQPFHSGKLTEMPISSSTNELKLTKRSLACNKLMWLKNSWCLYKIMKMWSWLMQQNCNHNRDRSWLMTCQLCCMSKLMRKMKPLCVWICTTITSTSNFCANSTAYSKTLLAVCRVQVHKRPSIYTRIGATLTPNFTARCLPWLKSLESKIWNV